MLCIQGFSGYNRLTVFMKTNVAPNRCCPDRQPWCPRHNVPHQTGRGEGNTAAGIAAAGFAAAGAATAASGLAEGLPCEVGRSSAEHTSELKSLMRISSAVFGLQK